MICMKNRYARQFYAAAHAGRRMLVVFTQGVALGWEQLGFQPVLQHSASSGFHYLYNERQKNTLIRQEHPKPALLSDKISYLCGHERLLMEKIP